MFTEPNGYLELKVENQDASKVQQQRQSIKALDEQKSWVIGRERRKSFGGEEALVQPGDVA